MKQTLQVSRQRLLTLRFRKGFLHLAQYLRLAQHQRVQAAGHPHQMADRLVILMPIETVAHLLWRQLMVATQPVDDLLTQIGPLLHAQIQLGAVTGRQHYPGLHRRLSQQAFNGPIQRIGRKRYPFPQGDRRRFMIDSKCKDS